MSTIPHFFKYGIIEKPDQYMALGFLNRKTNPLPEHNCAIKIIHVDVDGPSILLCSWKPEKESERILGTAKVIYGEYTGIGLHVHKQTDHEFIWYQIVDLELIEFSSNKIE